MLSPKRYKYLNEIGKRIDIDNFELDEFRDEKFVLTSPRSLEACAQLSIRPTELLPITLNDVRDEYTFNSRNSTHLTLEQLLSKKEIERKSNFFINIFNSNILFQL
jgi:hypothetical protein